MDLFQNHQQWWCCDLGWGHQRSECPQLEYTVYHIFSQISKPSKMSQGLYLMCRPLGGGALLEDPKLGWCDLVYRLYRSKLSFSMYSYARKIASAFEGCKQLNQTIRHIRHTYQSPFPHASHLTMNLFSRSQQLFEIWLCQTLMMAQIFPCFDIWILLHVLELPYEPLSKLPSMAMLWPWTRSPEVIMSSIRIHCVSHIESDFSRHPHVTGLILGLLTPLEPPEYVHLVCHRVHTSSVDPGFIYGL